MAIETVFLATVSVHVRFQKIRVSAICHPIFFSTKFLLNGCFLLEHAGGRKDTGDSCGCSNEKNNFISFFSYFVSGFVPFCLVGHR